jgi:hypothetical protein
MLTDPALLLISGVHEPGSVAMISTSEATTSMMEHAQNTAGGRSCAPGLGTVPTQDDQDVHEQHHDRNAPADGDRRLDHVVDLGPGIHRRLPAHHAGDDHEGDEGEQRGGHGLHPDRGHPGLVDVRHRLRQLDGRTRSPCHFALLASISSVYHG